MRCHAEKCGGCCRRRRKAAIPRVFRPLRKLRVGPRNLYGAGTERLAVPEKPFGLTLARLAALPFPGLLRDGPPMARLRKLRPACICHWQRQAAIPPVFRPLRKLRPRFFCRRQREACKRLAVPGKRFGLTLILAFSDRCGNCDPPASAAGGGGSQFLIILNSGGGDCFLLVTCGIVCPSKAGDGKEARRCLLRIQTRSTRRRSGG